MSDIKTIAESLQRFPLERRAIDKARDTIHSFIESGDQTEEATYAPNLAEHDASKIDFKMFLTGTVLRVKYSDMSNEEKHAWLVVEKEKNYSFVFLVKQKNIRLSAESLDKSLSYKLEPKGDFQTVSVADISNLIIRDKNELALDTNLTTIKVDVMGGGLAPKKGQPIIEFGRATLEPIRQENENK